MAMKKAASIERWQQILDSGGRYEVVLVGANHERITSCACRNIKRAVTLSTHLEDYYPGSFAVVIDLVDELSWR